MTKKKQYSIVIYDAKGNYLGESVVDKNFKATKRLKFSKAKFIDLYYGDTLKKELQFKKVSIPSSEKQLGARLQLRKIEKRREATLKQRRARKKIQDVVGQTYRLYDKNKKLINATNFRDAKFFSIFEGRKKIYFDDFQGLSTRQEKIEKIRNWRTREEVEAIFPKMDVKTIVKDITNRDGEDFSVRQTYGVYKSPITVPSTNAFELKKYLEAIREDMRKLFLKEWKKAGGTEKKFIFKIFTPMFTDEGKRVFEGLHYKEEEETGEKKETFDRIRTDYSYGFSNARTMLSSKAQFDLAFDMLEERWVRMMNEYISRSAAAYMTSIGLMVENVL